MRTEAEIEAGIVPGAEFITLGGKPYAVREPSNARSLVIRRALTSHRAQAQAAGADEFQQVELLETMLDTSLKAFSQEIQDDWERIEATATATERLEAIKVVGAAVMAPFLTLATPVQPAPNRKARRGRK